jgi:hypothetical protein
MVSGGPASRSSRRPRRPASRSSPPSPPLQPGGRRGPPVRPDAGRLPARRALQHLHPRGQSPSRLTVRPPSRSIVERCRTPRRGLPILRRSRSVVVGLLAIVVGAVLLAVIRADAGSPASAPRDRGSDAAGRAGNDESQEEGDLTASRLDALAEAKAAGKFGAKAVATDTPAPGWVGSRTAECGHRRLGAGRCRRSQGAVRLHTDHPLRPAQTCSSHCPTPYLALTTSKDGGSTWSAQAPMCVCRGARPSTTPPSRWCGTPAPSLGLPQRRSQGRLLRRVHQVHRPRHDVDGTGARLRQRRLDRQARSDDGPDRQEHLRLVERPSGR